MNVVAPQREWAMQVDWGKLAPLRLHARTVAEGVYAGAHRSRRRGPGVEFGGHREYVPGDDLRWIDRHALLRHDRLIVREFETETDRSVFLLVDATASMAFRGAKAPGAKVAFAALLAAALARIALTSGDPVAVRWIGGSGTRPVGPTSGGEAFERIVRALSAIKATGDAHSDEGLLSRALVPLARKARRGSVIVLLSDLLDLPKQSPEQFASLCTSGRRVVALQVLDSEEKELPYSGTVRLRSLEGDKVVETTPEVTRGRYLASLEGVAKAWSVPLVRRGGKLVRTTTAEDPVEVVREILRAIAEGTS